jgi:pilus assembly protein CpaF
MLSIRRNKINPVVEAPADADAQQGASPDAQREQTIRQAQRRREMAEIKARLHRQLVERVDLSRFKADSQDHRAQLRKTLTDLVVQQTTVLDARQRERLVAEVLDETFGLGPLEALLADPTVTDILINGPREVYIERHGRLEESSVSFRDDDHLTQIIHRIVSRVGRRVDESSPMVDARLPDGSRVNAIIPPLALDGPAMSIRRFGQQPMRIDDMLQYGSVVPEIVDFLAAAVQSKLNVLIVGGTGSGKTTLLNCLSSFIPTGDRVVTIEDAAELQLQQKHVVRLETRPANIEGRGEVTSRQLLKNALRMRPDRIIMGEVRGPEALDMLQAMNTGHEGSMTTLHANSTRDALSLTMRSIRQQFASAIHLIVQVRRLTGGPRRVVKVSEIQGMEGETITMQDLFKYEQAGLDTQGRAKGRFVATGLRSQFLERMNHCGLKVPASMFERRVIKGDA